MNLEVSLIGAFIAGLATFLAPCTFVTLPTFISFLSLRATADIDQDRSKHIRKVFSSALIYVFGFMLVFVILGATATSFNDLFLHNRKLFSQIGGLLIIFFGLIILVGDKFSLFNFLQQTRKFEIKDSKLSRSFIFPFTVGVTSAFAWTPCIGPLLGTILLLASNTGSVFEGSFLLFVYGMGINIPFLILSLLVGYNSAHANKFIRNFNKYALIIYKVSAFVMILIGISLLFGFVDRVFGPVFQLFVSWGYSPL